MTPEQALVARAVSENEELVAEFAPNASDNGPSATDLVRQICDSIDAGPVNAGSVTVEASAWRIILAIAIAAAKRSADEARDLRATPD